MRYARSSRRAIEWARDPASSRRFAGPAEQNGGAFPELRALLARFTAGYALDYLADDLHARARFKASWSGHQFVTSECPSGHPLLVYHANDIHADAHGTYDEQACKYQRHSDPRGREHDEIATPLVGSPCLGDDGADERQRDRDFK